MRIRRIILLSSSSLCLAGPTTDGNIYTCTQVYNINVTCTHFILPPRKEQQQQHHILRVGTLFCYFLHGLRIRLVVFYHIHHPLHSSPAISMLCTTLCIVPQRYYDIFGRSYPNPRFIKRSVTVAVVTSAAGVCVVASGLAKMYTFVFPLRDIK